MKTARLYEVGKPYIFSLDDIEAAIEKAFSLTGFDYCVIVSDRN